MLPSISFFNQITSNFFVAVLNKVFADHEEVPCGQSPSTPNLFLETLTHRSSWVMPSMAHRRRDAPSLSRQTASLPPDYDLHALEEEEGSHNSSPDGLLHAALQQSREQETAELPGYASLTSCPNLKTLFSQMY